MHCGDRGAVSSFLKKLAVHNTSKIELHTEEVWLVSHSGLDSNIKTNVKFTHYRLTASHNTVSIYSKIA